MIRSVAIIGLGSRGLGVLERIIALATGRPLVVHVIDPCCGGAGIHQIDQPDYLMLNTTCGQASMFPDPLSVGAETAVTGPSLYDWARSRGLRLGADGFTVGDHGRDLRPTDFLPRRVLGEYLGWYFDQLRQRLPDGLRLVLHRSAAVGIDRLPDGEMAIALEDGAAVRAAGAFITTGYTGNIQQPSDRLIAAPYPLPAVTEPIGGGQTVAIGGFGLTAMDVVSSLTAGRGGRFRRDQGDLEYLPGGAEPHIVMYSRSGLPCRARPQVTTFEFRYEPVVFTPAAIDSLRRPADFAVDVLPLVFDEMRVAYRRCQARCAGTLDALERDLASQDVGVVLDKLDGTLGVFDPAALFYGDEGMRLGSAADYQGWFADTIRRDLGEGLLGFGWSPVKAALDVLRESRDTFRYAVDFGGLTVDSCDDFFSRVVPAVNRAVVGPQHERHQELLALMAAGVLEVPLGPAPTVTSGDSGWVLRSSRLDSPRECVADWLVRAQVPLPSAGTSASPLLAALSARGWIRGHSQHGCRMHGIDIDADQHPLSADGEPWRRVWVLGPLCEGATFYNNLVPSPGVYSRPLADAHRCVTAMLRD